MPGDPTYIERPWSDVPQYVCLLCGYDAWSLTQLEVHMGFLHEGVALIKGASPPEAMQPAPVPPKAPMPEEEV
jgi:hypothetical protein